MSKREDTPETPVGRLDRFLAYTALALAAASIICFFAIIIGTATGMDQRAFGHGAWPVVAALPLYGLPLAFVMIITLLIITFVRRGRANKRS
ncbi:multidrug ABC transporter ATPase [Microbacterium sp. ARD32]|uniref:multidrug ABC transporter ATPase n=1 Tax=Microbacterium sp. ARD32 TaxID=2962577 RepID=UPI0028816F85|nr:multidrug ABC transporter ATPase [Microbacterium sp. ARD32]MDT0158554.1 multidrug ABC transporter ATPase [Microbacterium sp. ARD32]